MDTISYVLSFSEGVLSFISPCILPLLPVYFSYLAGTQEDADRPGGTGKQTLLANSIAFVIGFTIIYVFLGAMATSLGNILESYVNIDLLRKIGGIVMIIFGLKFLGVFELNFLNFEKKLHYEFKRLNVIKSVLFGIVFGFGWTPCIGYFLSSALYMAFGTGTVLQGILLLAAYSAGLGIPFILTAVLFEKLRNTFGQIQKHNRIISIISGIVLILAGILSFTDSLKYLSYINRIK